MDYVCDGFQVTEEKAEDRTELYKAYADAFDDKKNKGKEEGD
jgi:hypothetical protein